MCDDPTQSPMYIHDRYRCTSGKTGQDRSFLHLTGPAHLGTASRLLLHAIAPQLFAACVKAKMSLHFVETSEEESCLVVARYIGDVLDGEKVSRHKQLVFLKHQLLALV